MNLHRTPWALVAACSFALGFAGRASAADVPRPAAGPATQPATPGPATPLGVRQERVQQMMNDLQDKFVRLTESLKATEPEHAQRLRTALDEAQHEQLRERMAAICKLLNEDKLPDATAEQKKILTELRKLIALLTEEDDKLKEELDEAARLEALRAKLEQIIREETGHKRESDTVANKDQALGELERRIAALQGLIARQEKLRDQTVAGRTQGAAALGKLADPQKDLRRATEVLAKDLGQPPVPPTPAAPTPGTPTPGAPTPGAPTPGAPTPGAPTPGAPTPGVPTPGAPTPGAPTPGAPTPGAPTPAAPTPPSPSGSGNEPGEKPLARAVEHQKSAEDNLGDGKGKQAETNEDNAIKAMKVALDELQRERDRIARLPPEHPDKMAGEQDKTADKTADLGRQMSESAGGGAQGGKPGEPQDGAPPGDPDAGKTPGQDQVQKAQEAMRQASGNLRQKDPKAAGGKQQEALDRLKDAKQQIEDKLAQLRKDMQEELLAALEARFREMLARQKPATIATADLESARARKVWDRPERITCANLGQEEKALAELAQKALDIIRADGTTIVFPKVVEQLRDDLTAAGGMLQAERTDAYTQAVQKDIEKTLEELIAALQKAQQQAQNGDGQGQGDNQQNPPLVPESAELKMLKAMQLRVNGRTTAFDKARPPVLDVPGKTEVHRISKFQGDVANMAEDMAEKK